MFRTLICALILTFVANTLQLSAAEITPRVQCDGFYPGHLQGICLDESGNIYWSFTTWIVKSDKNGKLIHKVPAVSHQGDCCYVDGKVYVAVNLGKFNDPKGNADCWVYVYDADTLKELAKHEVQEVFHGAGGMAYHDGKFIVVGGLPDGVQENYLYEYDTNFKFVKKHVVDSGWTHLGIQGIAFADGHWWCACYGGQLLKVTPDYKMAGRYDFECGYGIVGLGDNNYYIARGKRHKDKGNDGYLLHARPDEKAGMKIILGQ